MHIVHSNNISNTLKISILIWWTVNAKNKDERPARKSDDHQVLDGLVLPARVPAVHMAVPRCWYGTVQLGRTKLWKLWQLVLGGIIKNRNLDFVMAKCKLSFMPWRSPNFDFRWSRRALVVTTSGVGSITLSFVVACFWPYYYRQKLLSNLFVFKMVGY